MSLESDTPVKFSFSILQTLLQETRPDPICDPFIDPPYTAGGKKAGKRLYKHYDLDHEYLFAVCETLKGNFLITYDNAEEVKKMARNHHFQMRLVPMNNTHHATMEELMIGRDLSWMDAFPSVHEPQSAYTAQTRKKKRCNKSIQPNRK